MTDEKKRKAVHPLIEAVRAGDEGLLKKLLNEAIDVNMRDDDSDEAKGLGMIAKMGGLDVVYQQFPDDMYGRTALMYAIESGNWKIAELLLEAGADIDLTDFLGVTPLRLAIDRGHVEIARNLLHSGAKTNIKDAEGFTPLANEAYLGHLEHMEILLEAEYSPVVLKDALKWARRNKQKRAAAMLENILTGKKGKEAVPKRKIHGRKKKQKKKKPQLLRGIGSFHVNESAILVRGDTNRVAETFSIMFGGTKVPDILDKQITLSRSLFFLIHFKGGPWTAILEAFIHEKGEPLSVEQAIKLSASLKTQVFYYEMSNTAGTLSYSLFDRGKRIERLMYPRELFIPAGEALTEESEEMPEVIFESQLGAFSADDIKDPYGFTHETIEDHKAFIPGWGRIYKFSNPNDRVRVQIEGFESDLIETIHGVFLDH